MYIKDKILNGIFHYNRLQQTYIRTIKVSVNTLAVLLQIINSGTRIIQKSRVV